MKKISRASNILSVSHNDLDGTGSAIILQAVFPNIQFITCSYYNIDEELMKVNPDDYDYIFVTDISPSMPEVLDRLPNSILIDHHQTASALHLPEKNRYVITKKSGTYLTKKYLDKMYGPRLLKDYRHFAYIINDYDMWEHNSPISKQLNDVYGLYDHEMFRKRFASGELAFNKRENAHIKKVQEEFDSMYDNLEILELEKINSCFFMSDVLVNELSQRLMEEEGYECVFFNTMKSYKISVRSTMDDFNFGMYFKERNIGGGHAQAAGINTDTNEEMTKMMEFLETDLAKRIPRIRR